MCGFSNPCWQLKLFIMDQIDKIEHRASMERKGNNINISFSPVTPNTLRVQSEQVEVTPSNITPSTSSDKPSVGPKPDINAVDFDFQAEINFLPFKLNMVEARHYHAISKSLHMPGSDCAKKDRGNSSVHGLPKTFLIMVRDAFPLPRINKSLQAVHSSNWFSSLDLMQGDLQLAMEESNIKKTAFRAGSLELYKFTHMPFGLLNVCSSFCHMMKQCWGDQQFVTLLLYLNDTCILPLQLMIFWHE